MKFVATLSCVLLVGVSAHDDEPGSERATEEELLTHSRRRSLKSSKSSKSTTSSSYMSMSWSFWSGSTGSSTTSTTSTATCDSANIFGRYNTVNLAIDTNNRLDTLNSLLELTGLDDTLRNYKDGPFTIFAPTDTAFNYLNRSIVERLLETEFLYHLTDLLLFHLVDGEVLCSAVVENDEAIEMANGESTIVRIDYRRRLFLQPFPIFDDQQSLIARVDDSRFNGVVHEISRVLQPVWLSQTLYDTLEENGYTSLAELVTLARLEDTLRDMDVTLTIFAPTNDAFDNLDNALVDCLLENPDILADLLLYHTVDTVADSTSLDGSNTLTSVQSSAITTEMTTSGLVVNDGSLVVEADVLSINGIVHGIDAALVYADFTCP